MEGEKKCFGQDNLGAFLEEEEFQVALSQFRLTQLWVEGHECFVGHKNKASSVQEIIRRRLTLID